MKKLLKGLCALLLCVLLMPCALADDAFTVDVDALDLGKLNNDAYVAAHLTAGTQGLRVRKVISTGTELASSVRLTLTQMDTGALLFDKNYGYQSGVFDSGVIYLARGGSGTAPYLITLYVGDYVYGIPFMHRQQRLESNGACTAGVRLRDLDPSQSGDWLMGTMVDLNDLRAAGGYTVQLCASNRYVIGTAFISLNGSLLDVQLDFDPSASVNLEYAQLYVVKDGQYLKDVRPVSLNAGADVSGANKALIYLPMEVSYDPDGLSQFRYDGTQAAWQQQLWKDAHGKQTTTTQTDSSPDWSSGWSDGWDDGWSSGW